MQTIFIFIILLCFIIDYNLNVKVLKWTIIFCLRIYLTEAKENTENIALLGILYFANYVVLKLHE